MLSQAEKQNIKTKPQQTSGENFFIQLYSTNKTLKQQHTKELKLLNYNL